MRRPTHSGIPGPGAQVDDLDVTVIVPERQPKFMPPGLCLGAVRSETIDAVGDLHAHPALLNDACHGERSRFRKDVRPLGEAVMPAQGFDQF